MKINYGPNFYS